MSEIRGRVVRVAEMTREPGGIVPQYVHVTVETDLGGDIQSGDRVTVTTRPVLMTRDALVASILAARWPGLVGSLALIEGISTATAGLIADQILADAEVYRVSIRRTELARELAEQNDAADIEQERRDDSAYDDLLDRIAGDQDRSELEDEE